MRPRRSSARSTRASAPPFPPATICSSVIGWRAAGRYGSRGRGGRAIRARRPRPAGEGEAARPAARPGDSRPAVAPLPVAVRRSPRVDRRCRGCLPDRGRASATADLVVRHGLASLRARRTRRCLRRSAGSLSVARSCHLRPTPSSDSPATRPRSRGSRRRRGGGAPETLRARLRPAIALRLAVASASPTLLVSHRRLSSPGCSALCWSLAARPRVGLGPADTALYVVGLVTVGYLPLSNVLLAIAWLAAAAQLAALAFGRYAPYAGGVEPPPAGLFRTLGDLRRTVSGALGQVEVAHREPAEISPAPRGTWTSASAEAARTIMCDS